MKKFYLTLVAVMFAATSAFAAAEMPAKVSLKKAENQVAQQITSTLELQLPTQSTQAVAPTAVPTSGKWVKISTGIWFEGPLASKYSDVDEGQWQIDIEQNDRNTGWYRVLPYTADSPLGQLMGRGDTTNYLYFNCTDPTKAVIEAWKPYGIIDIRSATAAGVNNYGNLTDGVIHFPVRSLIVVSGTSASYLNGEIKVVLDASTYKDYSISVDVPLCEEATQHTFSFTKGADVAKVKATILEGEYPMNETNANYTNAQGQDITAWEGNNIGLGNAATANTINTILYVTTDADGNVKESGARYFFPMSEDNTWQDAGTATYQEGIICNFFSDIDTEELTCQVQKHATIDGYIRLVNPYTNHSFPTQHTNHNHYIYINASDPVHVYMEPSAIGSYINSAFGDAAAMSWGYYYTDSEEDIAEGETDGLWGNVTDNTITIPHIRLMLNKYSPTFLNIADDDPFTVALPDGALSAIDSISTDDNANAPVEFYNLQGMKINNPVAGQVVIKRQGSKVVKTIVK